VVYYVIKAITPSVLLSVSCSRKETQVERVVLTGDASQHFCLLEVKPVPGVSQDMSTCFGALIKNAFIESGFQLLRVCPMFSGSQMQVSSQSSCPRPKIKIAFLSTVERAPLFLPDTCYDVEVLPASNFLANLAQLQICIHWTGRLPFNHTFILQCFWSVLFFLVITYDLIETFIKTCFHYLWHHCSHKIACVRSSFFKYVLVTYNQK